MRLLILLLLLCTSLAPPGYSETPTEAKMRLMAAALRARAEGDWEAVRMHLEALEALTPDNDNVRQMLKEAEAHLNDRNVAREQLEIATAMREEAQRLHAEQTISAPKPVEPEPSAEPAQRQRNWRYDTPPPQATPETAAPEKATEPARMQTRVELLQAVDRGWRRPQASGREETPARPVANAAMRERLRQIAIPRVNFAGVPLSRVIDTLSALSAEYDERGQGVNIVLIDPAGSDPQVDIGLRNLTLARILEFVTESVGYEYDVQSDAVVIRQSVGGGSRLETDFFPITRSTIIRLTGIGADSESEAAANPFVPAPSETSSGSAQVEEALKNFLQRAGVPFDNISGASLALADGQLIVTQTARNLEKVRNILRRYSDVKQVEIEARFLEVQQGDLSEVGVNWYIEHGPRGDLSKGVYQSRNRSLAGAFGTDPRDSELVITGLPTDIGNEGTLRTPVIAPNISNTLDLASDAANPLASVSGVIGEFDVNAVINALSRETGADLMSAPKLTVLSGKTAEIVVAQEMRYPQSYSDTDAEVGHGASDAGSAGVAVTAGTPRDFATRNVGVEMEVTPTVEDDNAISLLLEPKVTEFEGFVEYGGPSVAIASGTTVTVPSGFFQPIFSIRRIRTEVTIWDGATVIMGGLTREEAVTVEDKVPLLGDIPLLGNLFKSTGESSQKRNLMIFVTANLISPGGSPARQPLENTPPGTLYQQPTWQSPAGPKERE